MPFYNIDPSWFSDRWYGKVPPAPPIGRTGALVRLALSLAIIATTYLTLRHLGLPGV